MVKFFSYVLIQNIEIFCSFGAVQKVCHSKNWYFWPPTFQNFLPFVLTPFPLKWHPKTRSLRWYALDIWTSLQILYLTRFVQTFNLLEYHFENVFELLYSGISLRGTHHKAETSIKRTLIQRTNGFLVNFSKAGLCKADNYKAEIL